MARDGAWGPTRDDLRKEMGQGPDKCSWFWPAGQDECADSLWDARVAWDPQQWEEEEESQEDSEGPNIIPR